MTMKFEPDINGLRHNVQHLTASARQLCAIADDIQLAKAQLWAAQDAYDAGNYTEALSKVEGAEKSMGAAGARTLLLKAKSLYKLGRHNDAKRAASQFYSFDPDEDLLREMAPIFIGINEKAEAEAREQIKKSYEVGLKSYNAKDYQQSAMLFRKAADQGHARAQSYLGYMYEKGLGVTQSDSEAARWYRKAADQGDAYSQSNLGGIYKNGRGVTQSDSEAVRWYRKAADQGDARAQFNLGVMYEKGLGVTQSDSEGVRWYRKAADQGYAVLNSILAYSTES